MEVKLPALLGNYDRQIDRHATDRPGHREVTLPLSETKHTYERTEKAICINANVIILFRPHLHLRLIIVIGSENSL